MRSEDHDRLANAVGESGINGPEEKKLPNRAFCVLSHSTTRRPATTDAVKSRSEDAPQRAHSGWFGRIPIRALSHPAASQAAGLGRKWSPGYHLIVFGGGAARW